MNDETPKPPTTPPTQTPPQSVLPAAKPVANPTVILASGVTEKGRKLYAMYEKRFGKPSGN